jgi:hypothetical protein
LAVLANGKVRRSHTRDQADIVFDLVVVVVVMVRGE